MLKALLIGHVGKNPDIKQTSTNKKIASFSVASTYGTGNDAVTTWVTCEAWERTAEIVEKYVGKGSQVYVEGRIKLETWTDKEGKERTSLKMVVAELKLLGSRTSNDANDTKEAVEPWGQAQAERKQAPVEPWSRDETGLPF